jgi:hypothetical protein
MKSERKMLKDLCITFAKVIAIIIIVSIITYWLSFILKPIQ